jgi:hypothetical protein
VTRLSGIAFIILVVVCGGILYWRYHRAAPGAVATPAPPALVPAGPPPAAAPPAPAIRHPLPAAPAGELPSLDRADAYVEAAVVDLLGRKQVRAFLHVDGLLRRFVATVNNLATDDASASLWPVKTTAGRFESEARGGETVIAADNAARYAPFVRFAAGIDARRAVALYRRLYPLLQRAYEDLGFPGKYFNDRVVEVIDNLSATPAIAGPIAVTRFAADSGAAGSALYTYRDPSLEARSAGQKILLRMGPQNAAALTAKLAEVRAELVARPTAAR